MYPVPFLFLFVCLWQLAICKPSNGPFPPACPLSLRICAGRVPLLHLNFSRFRECPPFLGVYVCMYVCMYVCFYSTYLFPCCEDCDCLTTMIIINLASKKTLRVGTGNAFYGSCDIAFARKGLMPRGPGGRSLGFKAQGLIQDFMITIMGWACGFSCVEGERKPC